MRRTSRRNRPSRRMGRIIPPARFHAAPASRGLRAAERNSELRPLGAPPQTPLHRPQKPAAVHPHHGRMKSPGSGGGNEGGWGAGAGGGKAETLGPDRMAFTL